MRRRRLMRRPLIGMPARRALRRRLRFRRMTRRMVLRTGVVLLLGGTAAAGTYAAIKLHERDVRRIEQTTGRRAEDLSETELLAAMKRLGIQKLELTPEDTDAIHAANVEDGLE